MNSGQTDRQTDCKECMNLHNNIPEVCFLRWHSVKLKKNSSSNCCCPYCMVVYTRSQVLALVISVFPRGYLLASQYAALFSHRNICTASISHNKATWYLGATKHGVLVWVAKNCSEKKKMITMQYLLFPIYGRMTGGNDRRAASQIRFRYHSRGTADGLSQYLSAYESAWSSVSFSSL